MMTLSRLRSLCLFGASAALTACAALTSPGLMATRGLDPLTTPPGDIALAVGVPDRLRLRDGDATLTMSFRNAPDAPVRLEETVALRLAPAGATGPDPNSFDELIYVARIAPDDAARLARLQSEIIALRAQGVEGAGALGIAVVGGCHSGPMPDPLFLSSWIQTERGGDFVPLTRQQDLGEVLDAGEMADLRARFAPCAP